jgi:hypothetical protein
VALFATIFRAVSTNKPFAKQTQREAFTQRLREELTRSGRALSPVALSREINLHLRPSERVHASSCRKWLHAQAIPTQEKMQALSGMLQVSPSWLRFGLAHELKESLPSGAVLSADELSMLDVWRQLQASQRRTVRMLMTQLIKSGT